MSEAPQPHRRPRYRRKWWVVLEIVVAVVIVAVIVASHITLSYYAISPGDASPVDPLVKVPPSLAHPVHGTVLLTDVLESPVTLLSYLPDRLRSDTELIPSSEILGPVTPPDQLVAQGYLEMAQAKSAAKAAALQRLGYSVPSQNAGALIFAVEPGSPAAGVLHVAQIVTAVNNVPTPSDCAFVAALHDFAPGDRVSLAVEQSTVTSNAVIRPGPTVTRTVTLARAPRGVGVSGCPGVSGPARAYLGVEPVTQQNFDYPFPIGIDTTNIGGPSAGLAMTLGIIATLYDEGGLMNGRTVAATGTIDADGDVGPVGGVAQKTVAVERAGATVFFVPKGQDYRDAKSKDVPSLHVYAVSSLDDALAVLLRLGGHVPPAPSAATASTTTTAAAG